MLYINDATVYVGGASHLLTTTTRDKTNPNTRQFRCNLNLDYKINTFLLNLIQIINIEFCMLNII